MPLLQIPCVRVLSRISFALAKIRTSVLFCLLAGLFKLVALLSDMSISATERTDAFRLIGTARSRSRGSSRCGGDSSSSSSCNSGFVSLLILQGILNLLHCQFGLCKQGGGQSRVLSALEKNRDEEFTIRVFKRINRVRGGRTRGQRRSRWTVVRGGVDMVCSKNRL